MPGRESYHSSPSRAVIKNYGVIPSLFMALRLINEQKENFIFSFATIPADGLYKSLPTLRPKTPWF
jgi:hypothetical protein